MPVVAFLVLTYLALAENQLRWRWAEVIVTIVLMLPALLLGVTLASIHEGCLVFGP